MLSRVYILLSSLLLVVTHAVPAIVFTKQPLSTTSTTSSSTSTSHDIPISDLLSSIIIPTTTTSLTDDITKSMISIMFLLDRNITSGQELVTTTVPYLLQTMEAVVSNNHNNDNNHIHVQQHLHITGLESHVTVKNMIHKTYQENSSNHMITPVIVTMDELMTFKLNMTVSSSSQNNEGMIIIHPDATMMTTTTTSQKKLSKRQVAIQKANFFIVPIPYENDNDSTNDERTTIIDTIVLQSLQHTNVQNVIVSGIRSIEEVKYERDMIMRRQLLQMNHDIRRTSNNNDINHRRLEDKQQNNYNNNNQLAGVYYVQMTPNILSGLLFFVLFSCVIMIGISCMNMISGQDVYVSKMPYIGREA